MEDIYISGCKECQYNKFSTKGPADPLYLLLMPDRHGKSVAIDFIGPLPENNGKDCIATTTDHTC